MQLAVSDIGSRRGSCDGKVGGRTERPPNLTGVSVGHRLTGRGQLIEQTDQPVGGI
jgi:hypothetical protein